MASVEVVCSPAARQVVCLRVSLPPSSTVAQALHACAQDLWSQCAGLQPCWPALVGEARCGDPGQAGAEAEPGWTLCVGGKPVRLDTQLSEGDRLDIVRPLKVDPKEARRVRYRAHGERGRRRVSGTRSR